ncbi:hypothetical protein CLN94_08310 [Pseudothioclava arenosa]|uniref:POTRA domain-containing protein n=1 Tax=Pseudothioclava arenosa TaxID=1795308 RepID=A0A2A4CQM8_9RHOB|nr:hypothetical protein CLN94_08310 [Pseudothioclava arenosa]
MRFWRRTGGCVVSVSAKAVMGLVLALGSASAVMALDLQFSTPGAPDDLRAALRQNSVTVTAADNPETTTQELLAAALADYSRLLATLYDAGYYGGRISLRLNGREAATIALLDAPETLSSVEISVEPGPVFTFGKAELAPLAKHTKLPEGFRPGAVAQVSVIQEAVSAGIEGWRQTGHAKAAVGTQALSADHRKSLLDAAITIAPGERLRFGQMEMTGYERMNPRRLAKIAGFPTGEWFDPDDLDEVRQRLRRTGIFNAVSLVESDTVSPENTLDATLTVAEAPLRRLGFGAELASFDGLDLSAYWLHRNLFGGGARLRVDGAIEGIGGSNGGMDYSLGARIDRPATLGADTSAFVEAEIYRAHEADYISTGARLGFGLEHIFNPRLTGSAALSYGWQDVEDEGGDTTRYSSLALPVGLIWDNRDSVLDATSGYFGELTATPFVGFNNTGTGAQIKGDFRAYRAFGDTKRLTLAGRLQFGKVFGSDLAETPRDYLFFSGGGGTVRGQPYQSLGVDVLDGGTLRTGGTEFLAFSTELRTRITPTIGLVAFYDAGHVSDPGVASDFEDWHAGAGLGLRYLTGIGPIRLDIAQPVSGDTGEGTQIYIGIGQAF